MSTYRLVVYSGDQEVSQGTAWLVRPDFVVTAFHVVGKLATRGWLHEGVDRVRYMLMTGSPVGLNPLFFDAQADIALLQATEPVPGLGVLGLAPAGLRRDMRWRGSGFPGFNRGAPFTLSGTVVDLHSRDPSSEIQLLVEQGTQVSWTGVSGTPVCAADSGCVLGVITQVTDATNTGWAATAAAVQRLLQRWDAMHIPGADSRAAAGICGTWRRLTSGIIQWLGDAYCRGVALLGPIGFGARQVVDLTMTQLAQPHEKLIPVRLVPDRSSGSESWLYRKLARDLWDGLARAPQVQDGRGCAHGLTLAWHENEAWPEDGTRARERFALMVEELIRGPLKERDCTLVLFMEGLARMPEEQLVRWGFLMKRLSDHGLKLGLWGGRELHALMTRPVGDGAVSAFHVLQKISLERLDENDILQLLQNRLGNQAQGVARIVYTVTGGHPALVREIADLPPLLLGLGNADEMREQLLGCMHVERLWREVENHAELRNALRRLAAHTQEPLPRKLWSRAEQELHWLGILIEIQGGWQWAAPVMRRLGEELIEEGA